tara:strand:- start:35354 stop:35569 length:216 start_codon:yes stop_codon:yes gene_type:complete
MHVDLSNYKCPLLLLKVRQYLEEVKSGEEVEFKTKDPVSWKEFHSYAKITGNNLLEAKKDKNFFYFVIKRK